jgi:quercetin dioxygenase-like cupin family protein
MTRNRLLRSAWMTASAASLLALFGVVNAAEPDPKALEYKLPENIKWTEGKGSQTAVLYGDPSKPGLYIELMRWQPGSGSRPHSHPNDRYITVLSGTWWVGTGKDYDMATTKAMPAGSFVLHHANEIHYDGAKDGEVLLQLVGMGPADTRQSEKK